MQVVRTILVILEVLASIGLVLVVLFQSGKESGLGAIAGNTETYMGKNSASTLDKKLASWTKWIALAWVVLIIAVHCV
ncbi:MAG: preprotein translocase subunit SecG [Oscillospiraceae bacterium]|jgi:preprotein translocase subunit SecG|nr:preprotein translocase subunit SecG [Oscillospiraceae bacterium]MBQ2384357.1 preprotein translocase subunit SecG [Oscillospiraceae bacterium]MBQ5712325.1 preprotein translocase subunit SecG [Oscillospiraceae bacterium]